MNRRTLLRRTGVACALGVAGCVGNAGNGTASPTPTPTPDTPAGSVVEAATLTVEGVDSGQQADDADVSFGSDAVVVEGIIWGENGCKTAALDAAEYDPETDTLRVAVGTTDREDAGEVCTETIVEIDYRARVTVSDGPPGTVEVSHGGRAVTSADRGG